MDAVIPGVSAAIVIALVLFARWFDRRRVAACATEQNSQNRLLDKAIDNVERDFSDRLTFVGTDFSRTPRGFAGYREDKLLIVLLVDLETERSPAFEDALAEIDAQVRHELLMSGYFRHSSEVVSVRVMSRWRYENTDWFR